MSETLKENQDEILEEIEERLTKLTPVYKIRLVRLILTPEVEREIAKHDDPQIKRGLALLYKLWARNKDKDPAEAEKIIQESIGAVRTQHNA